MSTATIAGIIIASVGALIIGMAALIKTMVLGRMTALQESISQFAKDMNEMDRRLTQGNAILVADIHEIDLRLNTIETEHKIKSSGAHACIHTCKD